MEPQRPHSSLERQHPPSPVVEGNVTNREGAPDPGSVEECENPESMHKISCIGLNSSLMCQRRRATNLAGRHLAANRFRYDEGRKDKI